MAKITVKELRKEQMALCDSLILDTDKMDEIMRKHTQKLIDGEFHCYSINNLLLADAQLRKMTGVGIQLLAPYSKWPKVNRNVKYGSKALFILAPIVKKIHDEDTDEVIDTKLWFKKVPVFDLIQTEGERFEFDFVEYDGNITFADIIARTNIPVLESNQELVRGKTDGKRIWVSKYLSDPQKIVTFLHELGHYYLHFDENRNELTTATKELEAQVIAHLIGSGVLQIKDHESAAYIRSWAGNNSHELIKNKGTKLIHTAQKIIDDLDLVGLLETKV